MVIYNKETFTFRKPNKRLGGHEASFNKVLWVDNVKAQLFETEVEQPERMPPIQVMVTGDLGVIRV